MPKTLVPPTLSGKKAWTQGRAGTMEMDPDERAMVECDAQIVAGDDSAGTPGHVSRTIPPWGARTTPTISSRSAAPTTT